MRYAVLWRALTNNEADQIRSQGIKAPILVSPNGVDLGELDEALKLRNTISGERKQRSLLFLARLHPSKGLGILLPAWAAVPKSIRNDWRLVIAGPNIFNHRSEMEALGRQLHISSEIKFVGTVTGSAKTQILAEADAMVLPSYSEGFSVAILEAMACRLPVVATDACNFPELEREGGGWCTSTTADGLKCALMDLFSATEVEMEQRGNAARCLVERSYTWPNIAKQISDACAKLIY
jgi:glycosyltransferase involved in cell wall biosynthesis